MRKYFTSKKEAVSACEARRISNPCLRVWKMPKGSRHKGQYAVCSEVEYLNTY